MSFFDATQDDAALPAGLPNTSPGTRWERPVLRVCRSVGAAVTASDIRASRRPCSETYSRHFSSRLSPYLSAGLLNIGVSPNAVTASMLPVGLVAALIFLLSTEPAARLVAALLLVLVNILDTVDGEMARFSGRTSTFGVLLDKIIHVVVDFAVYTGVGVGLMLQTGWTWLLVATWLLVLTMALDVITVEATRRMVNGARTGGGSGWSQVLAGNVGFYHLIGFCILGDLALRAGMGFHQPVIQSGYLLLVAVNHVLKSKVRIYRSAALLSEAGGE